MPTNVRTRALRCGVDVPLLQGPASERLYGFMKEEAASQHSRQGGAVNLPSYMGGKTGTPERPHYFRSKTVYNARMGKNVTYYYNESQKTWQGVPQIKNDGWYMFFVERETPLGREIGGMKVNLSILGLTFQPSEIAKYLILLFMAAFFTQRADTIIAYSQPDRTRVLEKVKTLGWVIGGLLLLMAMYAALGDMGPALVIGVTFVLLYSLVKSKVNLEHLSDVDKWRRIFTCTSAGRGRPETSPPTNRPPPRGGQNRGRPVPVGRRTNRAPPDRSPPPRASAYRIRRWGPAP